jgi:hypothetical protein
MKMRGIFKKESHTAQEGNLPFLKIFFPTLISTVNSYPFYCHCYYSSNKPLSVVQPYEKLSFFLLHTVDE